MRFGRGWANKDKKQVWRKVNKLRTKRKKVDNKSEKRSTCSKHKIKAWSSYTKTNLGYETKISSEQEYFIDILTLSTTTTAKKDNTKLGKGYYVKNKLGENPIIFSLKKG